MQTPTSGAAPLELEEEELLHPLLEVVEPLLEEVHPLEDVEPPLEEPLELPPLEDVDPPQFSMHGTPLMPTSPSFTRATHTSPGLHLFVAPHSCPSSTSWLCTSFVSGSSTPDGSAPLHAIEPKERATTGTRRAKRRMMALAHARALPSRRGIISGTYEPAAATHGTRWHARPARVPGAAQTKNARRTGREGAAQNEKRPANRA